MKRGSKASQLSRDRVMWAGHGHHTGKSWPSGHMAQKWKQKMHLKFLPRMVSYRHSNSFSNRLTFSLVLDVLICMKCLTDEPRNRYKHKMSPCSRCFSFGLWRRKKWCCIVYLFSCILVTEKRPTSWIILKNTPSASGKVGRFEEDRYQYWPQTSSNTAIKVINNPSIDLLLVVSILP